jgi:hypothetical protein
LDEKYRGQNRGAAHPTDERTLDDRSLRAEVEPDCRFDWDLEDDYPLLGACVTEGIGPYFPDVSLNRTTIRLKIEKICPRFSTFSLRSLLPRRLLARRGLFVSIPRIPPDRN